MDRDEESEILKHIDESSIRGIASIVESEYNRAVRSVLLGDVQDPNELFVCIGIARGIKSILDKLTK